MNIIYMAPVVPQKKEEVNPEEKLVFDNAPEPPPEPVPETEPVVEPVPEPVQEEFKPVANREPTPYKPRELIVEEEFVVVLLRVELRSLTFAQVESE